MVSATAGFERLLVTIRVIADVVKVARGRAGLIEHLFDDLHGQAKVDSLRSMREFGDSLRAFIDSYADSLSDEMVELLAVPEELASTELAAFEALNELESQAVSVAPSLIEPAGSTLGMAA